MSKRRNVLALASLACAMLILPSCSYIGSTTSDSSTSSEVQKTYFAISYSADENCTITALDGYDPSKVEQGKDFRFKIDTLEGYSVSEVFVDKSGYSLLPDEDGVYSIANVNSNLTIACSSSVNTFRLVFSSGSFTMTPVDSINSNKIPYGSDFRFTLKADAHNKIIKVTYKDAELTPNEEGVYTINAVKASSFVNVSTEEETYKIVLPTQEGFSIELADPSLDLNSVAYSKEIKFKVTPAKYHQIDSVKIGDVALEKGDDDYYVIKNQEGEVNLAVLSSIIKCKVTFDTNGASTSLDSITQDAGTKLAEPTAPSKTLDDYYDSVTFDGWYSKDGKFDFDNPLEGDTNLTARYVYGNVKKEIVNEFNSSDFTFIGGAKASTSIRGSFNGATWSQYEGAAAQLDKLEADFGRTLSDGVLIHAGNDKSGTGFTMPKINFKSLLAGGNTIYMETGAFNTNNYVTINGTNLLSNGSDSSIQVATSLRNAMVSFKLGSNGKVTAYLKNILSETPFTCASNPSAEVELTDAQASGEEGITCTLQKGSTRLYWFAKPYIVKAERQVVDFSSLKGYTLNKATSKTAEKLAIQGSKDGVMINCNGESMDDKSVITLDPINFSEYFQNGEGLRFNVGTNSSQDEIAWISGETETSLGKNNVAPANEAKESREEMICSWQNWQFDINKAGVFVTNKNEGKEYFVSLSSAVLAGQEGLKIRLSSSSESIDKSYIVSNIMAYKA